MGRAEAAERQIEACDRCLLGDALAPGLGAKAPADFVLASHVGARAVHALDPAEAEDVSGRAILYDPECVPELRLAGAHAFVCRAPLLRQLHAAEMLHHLATVHDLVETDLVHVVPLAQTE